MDPTVIMNLPEKFELLEKLLKEADWLRHFFPASKEQLYKPANFQYNISFSNTTYTIFIDSNIYIYILSAFDKPPEDNFRKAIGLLYFCIISGIQLEPFLPVMEEISYEYERANQSIRNLDLFYIIDNYDDIDSLLNYAVGTQDKLFLEVNIEIKASKNGQKIREWHRRYQSLWKWDLFYIACMKIVIIDQLPESNDSKLKRFILWEKQDFQYSRVSTAFAMICFSTNRIRGMIKFKKKYGQFERKKAIQNMTWDLYLIDHFIKKFGNKPETEEFILASADRALREVCELAIKISSNQDPEQLKKVLDKETFNYWTYSENIFKDTTIVRHFPVDQDNKILKKNQMRAKYEDTLGI